MEYFHQFNVIAKGRWIGLKILDMLAQEYKSKKLDYYIQAIQIGAITINNEKVTLDYIIQNNDRIQHLVHLHEPSPINIPIIDTYEDLIIINKPTGIACHPVSGYKYFTVTEIMKKKLSLKDEIKVSCINRIDVPVSGIVILAINNARKYHLKMMKQKIEKYYLALVKGSFESQVVDLPLKKGLDHKTVVDKDGKPAKTIFRTIKSGKYSLVECQPVTGRSHQIRAHLAYLGYPIVGDVMYGYDKFLNNQEHVYNKCKAQADECRLSYSKEVVKFVLDNCRGTDNRAYRYQNYKICLHAYKYKIEDKEFVTEMPSWAVDYVKP